MSRFSDEEIRRIIEAAEDVAAGDVPKRTRKAQSADLAVGAEEGLDEIPEEEEYAGQKGGTWGVTGMGQTPEMFSSRTGVPGLNTSSTKNVTPGEAQKLNDKINQVEPDRIVAYSRGAPLYNLAKDNAKPDDAINKAAVTYMAPSSYRNWGYTHVPGGAPGGSKVMIGDEDTIVPIKQAAKNAVEAGNIPLEILPGHSHTSIMYGLNASVSGGTDSKAKGPPFRVDPQSIANDPDMPDWGAAAFAPGTKGNRPDLDIQRDRIKAILRGETSKKKEETVRKEAKDRKLVSDFVKLILSR